MRKLLRRECRVKLTSRWGRSCGRPCNDAQRFLTSYECITLWFYREAGGFVLKSLSVLGLRGFATRQTLEFAIPSGELGSGLTIIVGANNAGKSTMMEALRALAADQGVSVTQGKRNEKAGDLVEISVTPTNGQALTLKSVTAGSSETVRVGDYHAQRTVLVIPSRRTFAPYFHRNEWDRTTYIGQGGLPAARESAVANFNSRLFRALKNQEGFNRLLARVIHPVPSWTIDQADSGQHFVKIRNGDSWHSSEGAGEGFVSLLFLIDGLYDSAEGDLIAIDEPELSLHPSVQRRLCGLIAEYAATRQIVVSTHSPYFVDIHALATGGRIARAFRRDNASELSHLSRETALRLYEAARDMNNPHLMGLDAREVFFLEDNIILVEGQEDVMFLSRALSSIETELNGTVFGWGAGGAEKIELIAKVLDELSFKKVVGLVDADKAGLLGKFRAKFPRFHFAAIPANDIRSKPATRARDAKIGLLDDGNETVRQEYWEDFAAIVRYTNAYLSGKDDSPE